MNRILSLWWVTFIAGFVLLAASLPFLDNLDSHGYRLAKSLADLDLLRTTIEQFRIAHGSAPNNSEKLNALVAANLIEHLPSDPWMHPYVYSVDTNGTYKVYSVGVNGLDEQGEGDDVVNREKRYRCEDYDVNCLPNTVYVIQISSFLITIISLLIGIIRGVMYVYRRLIHLSS